MNIYIMRKNFCIYVTAEREIIFFFLICKIEEKRQPLSFYLFLSLLISFSLLLIPHKQITKNICQQKKMRITSPVSQLHGFFFSLLKTTVTAPEKKTKRYGEKVNFHNLVNKIYMFVMLQYSKSRKIMLNYNTNAFVLF